MGFVKTWLFGKALHKALIQAGIFITAYVGSLGLEKYGLRIEVEMFQEAVIAGLITAMNIVRNYFKVKKTIDEK